MLATSPVSRRRRLRARGEGGRPLKFSLRKGGRSADATPLGSSYLLVEPIGRGGMGRVWRGAVRATGETVAVKVLNPELAADPEVVSRFLQERGILVGLDHPHLVGVRDLVAEGDTLAIVMDLVQGSDLRRYLVEHGPVAPAFAAGLTAQALTGLAAVHSVGIVHRDLKPENILLDLRHDGPPRALLSDFGIARLATGPGLTRTTGLIGTPEYMAPEMADLVDVGPAADIYAAGTVLYELLVGRTPFAGGPAVAVLLRHVDEPPVRPGGVTDALWQLLSEMLAKRPEQRPTAVVAADRLVALVPGLMAAPAVTAVGSVDGDPNATRLPGHHGPQNSACGADGGAMAVPMPLGGAGPQRATAAAGDQQMTMLPGAIRPAHGPLHDAGRASGSRRAALVVVGVVVALLVVAGGIGLLARSGSHGPTASSAPARSPVAASTAYAKLNDGEFDSSFDQGAAGFVAASPNIGVAWTPAAAGAPAYVQFTCRATRCIAQRNSSAAITFVEGQYIVLAVTVRSHTGSPVAGVLQLTFYVKGAQVKQPVRFHATGEWVTMSTRASPSRVDVPGVGLLFTNLELSSVGAILDMRMVAYTYRNPS